MENRKIKIIFFGTPHFVIPVLETLTQNFDVVAVVTAPDSKTGRKQLLTPSPIKVFADKHAIPVFQPEKLITSNISLPPSDLFIVAAYGKLIPQALLNLPQYGTINIHPSLLPQYRGPTPVQTAILNGDKKTGISFMQMDAKMDHGPILAQYEHAIKPSDTFASLVTDLFLQSSKLLLQVINDYLNKKVQPHAQDEKDASYSHIIIKQDGFIQLDSLEIENWKLKIDRMIRAYYPWPAVWTQTTIKNQKVRIKFLPNKMLQVEGKKPIHLKDFLNGYPEMKERLQKIF